MKLIALIIFIPSGILIPFFALGAFATTFLFDKPFSGIGDMVLRNLIAICVFSYPLVWLFALVLTIIAMLKDWSEKCLITFAVFPFLVAAMPFFLASLLKYV